MPVPPAFVHPFPLSLFPSFPLPVYHPCMHIISASRRTDIPAFYSPWLMNRLRDGYALVPNPFNPRQVSRVNLRPEQVACLVLVTKDPRPLLPHLDELEGRGYRFLFQVTVTGLPRFLEPGVPEAEVVIEAVRRLAARIGPGRVTWRFDPILLAGSDTSDAPLSAFRAIAKQLEGSVGRVIISFAREYATVKSRLRGMGKEVTFLAPVPHLKERIAAGLAEEAARHRMAIQSCAESHPLAPFGIAPGKCIDPDQIRELFGVEFRAGKAQGQRSDCLCARSADIGIYGTCPHRCLYCYASCDAAFRRGEVHDPLKSALLSGIEHPGDLHTTLPLPGC